MKIIIHKMKDCPLCKKCVKLFEHWKIPFKSRTDWFEPTREYPYVTIELEYKEVVKWIAEGKLR